MYGMMSETEHYQFLMRSVEALQAALNGPQPEGEDHDAPVLDDYLFVLEGQMTTLYGRTRGHPRFGSASIRTSPLIHVTQDQKWARTLSRWYRLENPHRFDTSRLSPDIDLVGYCTLIGVNMVNIPLYLARRIMCQCPTQLARNAAEGGGEDVKKALSEFAETEPPAC